METIQSAVYATQPKPLQKQIESLLRDSSQPPIEGEILSIIVPDSNLLSGGSVAAAVYQTLAGRKYDTVVTVAPSHTGNFRRITICSLNTYQSPLGQLQIDEHARQELCDEDDDIFLDDTGHFHTKGVDVQLPFLQNVLPEFDLVPIVMGADSAEFCRELGTAIGEIMFNRKTLVVSSVDILDATDPGLSTFQELFEKADVNGLMRMLNSEQIVLEGKGPLLVAMIASLHRKANQFQIIELHESQSDMPGFLGAVISR